MEKKRNLGLDIIKGFAAMLVCMLHLLHVDFGEVVPGELYLPNITKLLYGVCACSVPIFFFVNGFLIGHRKNDPKSILIKIFNLVKLRIVWGVLLGALICLIADMPNTIYNYKELTFYLWFFEALIVIYAFVLIWDRLKDYKWSIVFPIFLFIIPFVSNFVGLIASLLGYPLPDFFGHSGFFRLYGLLYFMLPFYMKGKTLSKKMAIFAVIVGVSEIALEVFVWSNACGKVYDGMNACFPTIGALLMTIGFFSLFTAVEYNENNKLVKYMSWLGRNCMGVYLFHMPFIYVFGRFICHTNIPAICAILVSVIIISLSAVVYTLLLKVKYVNYLLKI